MEMRHGGRLILEGRQFTIIAAVFKSGTCPFGEWLESQIAQYNGGAQEIIGKPRDSVSEGLSKLNGYFKRFADHGPWHNKQLLRTLGDDLYEFKHKSSGLRVPFYYDERNRRVIILTHGFIKKKQKEPHDGKKRAIEIRRLFEEWRDKANEL
jgi:phage-related protein